MRTESLRINQDYSLECPDDGNTMKLENVFESVLHPEVGQLWHCKFCGQDFHLKLVKFKPKKLDS